MPNPVKLRILLTGEEVMGLGVSWGLHGLLVVTDCSRKCIPLYEFKCTKNLTQLLKDHFKW